MKHSFEVGQHIQLNKHGRARMPRVRSHAGTVVKVWEHSETIRIVFDGQVTPLSLHFRYVEPTFPKTNVESLDSEATHVALKAIHASAPKLARGPEIELHGQVQVLQGHCPVTIQPRLIGPTG